MYISKEKVKKLSVNFRSAIDQAKELGEFDHYNDFSFFPSRCCGNVSYLLAYYLRLHGIETIWVSYRRADWRACPARRHGRAGKGNRTAAERSGRHARHGPARTRTRFRPIHRQCAAERLAGASEQETTIITAFRQ